MAQYESRVVTTQRKEFFLKLPTDWIEVEKLMAAAKQDIDASDLTRYPFVEVTATDEELIFSFEVSKDEKPN